MTRHDNDTCIASQALISFMDRNYGRSQAEWELGLLAHRTTGNGQFGIGVVWHLADGSYVFGRPDTDKSTGALLMSGHKPIAGDAAGSTFVTGFWLANPANDPDRFSVWARPVSPHGEDEMIESAPSLAEAYDISCEERNSWAPHYELYIVESLWDGREIVHNPSTCEL